MLGINTIEFQKRGLPHAHILITMKEGFKFRNTADYDKLVHAELPDETHPLFAKVMKHMIHGSCGHLKPNSPCMADGKCTKKFPKE